MTGYELTKAFYDELAINEAMHISAKPQHLSQSIWIRDQEQLSNSTSHGRRYSA
ncbi:hypothetical protein [uncultured Fibrella sp.]|uniref:hypothetical protein n=1 Tax=uncultured Fibrella sp. TaxID=1284596 RepID=UPI0035CB9B7F